jgi:basic membrane protein A and related proteins
VGTLKNGSVSLASFHNLDSSVPTSLKDQLARIKRGIADGTISVDPKDYLP